jgi:tetratricopeptide (TPR) repeat protein
VTVIASGLRRSARRTPLSCSAPARFLPAANDLVRLALFCLVVLMAGTAGAASAADTARASPRLRALAELGARDDSVRSGAIRQLAQVGTMADTPALVNVLHGPDPVARELAEAALWRIWSRSNDAGVDRLFERAMGHMGRGDVPRAVSLLTEVIRRKPNFAEGWNKRATLYFMMGEYRKSLRDCAEVIKRNPSHFGALAGFGQIYLRLEQPERALAYFERALQINPNMSGVERMVEQLRDALTRRADRTI